MMSIYDVIAKIAMFLHETNNEYNIISDYNCCDNHQELRLDFDWKDGFSNLGSCADFTWLDDKIDELIKLKDYRRLIKTMQDLDNRIDYYDYGYYDDENDIFTPLNSRFLNKILVLPQMFRKTKWTHSNDDLSETVNKVLKYVFIVFVSDLGEYKLINHYVKLDYCSENFIVAGSPVCNNTNLKVCDVRSAENVKMMKFRVSYENESKFVDNVTEIIRKADEMEASLVAFPELISNYVLNKAIVEKIKNIKFKFIKFIALPTFYDEKNIKNVGEVYFTEEKRVLFSQCKTFPFVKYSKTANGEDVKEMLCDNKEIHILHVKGVGRIIFPVCKDVLVDKYMSICKATKANLIVTRSYSPGEYNYIYFLRIIRGYTSFECCGFWINSCNYVLNDSDKRKVICITVHSKCDQDENDNPNYIHYCNKHCNDCLIKFTVN